MAHSSIPEMKTIKQTAEMFGVSQYFVRKLATSGRINAVRVAGRILVNCDRFAEYLNSATLSNENTDLAAIDGIRSLG
ncbi:MAG: helix-turn-helix domain-containing protein [Lachnospiraceae bacterium]|nr:helix-turn-helix domain-containing protein [Ruminococcus sp.]MCM1275002.1 helix-turn-helix domain-containing protein [Lachnospiraceae bacterium]